MTNDKLRNAIILMAAAALFVLAIYFIASPYQNCVRGLNGAPAGKLKVVQYCSANSTW
jgi:hypothetical protein